MMTRRMVPFLALIGCLFCLSAILAHYRGSAEQLFTFHLTADEALHSELIEVMKETGQYSRWNGPVFAQDLTAGPTFILPSVYFSKLTSLPSALSGRLVSFFFHLSLGLLFILWRRRTFLDVCVGILSFWVFLNFYRANSEMEYFTYGVLADGVGLFFVVLSLFLFKDIRKRSLFFAGFFSLLAVISKPYFLLFPPALLAALFFSNSKDKKESGAVLGFGMVSAFSLLIASMVAGAGFEHTFAFFKTYLPAMKQVNGVSIELKEVSHFAFLKALLSQFKLRSLALCGVSFIFAFILFLKSFSKKQKLPFAGLLHDRVNLAVLIYTISQFLFWLFLTPDPRSRYFAVIVVVLGVFFSESVTALLKEKFAALSFTRLEKLAFLLCAITLLGFQVKRFSEFETQSRVGSPFLKQLALQKEWKKLPIDKPKVYVLEGSYSKGAEILLSAPHDSKSFSSKETLPTDGLIVVSEESKEVLYPKLTTAQCKNLTEAIDSKLGFWKCEH